MPKRGAMWSLAFIAAFILFTDAQYIGNYTCSSTMNLIALNVSQTFTSPGYPAKYSNFLRCEYVISSLDQSPVELIVQSFSTESCCDKLTLSDGSQTTRWRGTIPTGAHYVSYSGTILATFETDSSVQEAGFVLQYKISRLPRPENVRCESSAVTLHASPIYSQSLLSPNFPHDYYSNQHCEWEIHAPADHVVNLTRISFFTEECCDSLRIYTGPTEDHEVAVWRGLYPTTESVSSSCYIMRIIFKSDFSRQMNGFYLEYTAVPKDRSYYEDSHCNKPLSVGAIIGIVIGTITLFMIVCCACCKICSKRASQLQRRSADTGSETGAAPAYPSSNYTPNTSEVVFTLRPPPVEEAPPSYADFMSDPNKFTAAPDYDSVIQTNGPQATPTTPLQQATPTNQPIPYEEAIRDTSARSHLASESAQVHVEDNRRIGQSQVTRTDSVDGSQGGTDNAAFSIDQSDDVRSSITESVDGTEVINQSGGRDNTAYAIDEVEVSFDDVSISDVSLSSQEHSHV